MATPVFWKAFTVTWVRAIAWGKEIGRVGVNADAVLGPLKGVSITLLTRVAQRTAGV